MNKALPILLVALTLSFVSLAGRTAASSARPDIEQRVGELENALAKETAAHAETRKLLEQTLTYLHGQAKGATDVLSTLDRSESLGFTKGINFESREVLLSGFRGYWGTLEKGLPELPKKAAKPAALPARKR